MATEEHKQFASIIKNLHETLRDTTEKIGAEQAWEEHLRNKAELGRYAEAMKGLAEIWESNSCDNGNSGAISRITWILDYVIAYFHSEKLFQEKREREIRLATAVLQQNQLETEILPQALKKINLLDVGSCFNPFKQAENFNVTAIDISPANESVYESDFLHVNIAETFTYSMDRKKIVSLPKQYFHCIVFSLLLEYLPSSEQRLLCCQKAYELLKYEGILIIITPDSHHVGKNAKLMKNWRYTLALMGFSRIKFEKLPHITCLVFRKCLSKKLTERWAAIHREDYMKYSIITPQDLSKNNMINK